MVDYLQNFVKKIIQNEIDNLKFDKKIRATVQSIGSGVATIRLLDSSQDITNVKIRGELIGTLVPTDEVYVTLINGNINNMFIDVII